MPTFQKRFPTGGIKSQGRPFFKMKKFRKKFFDNAYFGGAISARDFLIFMGTTFGEKFFCNVYFCKSLFEIDFLGKKIHDNFCFFARSLFQIDFFGKKIYDKLFALYRQKTPGTGRGGGSGPGMGEYLGVYARTKMKKPPESVVFRSEGTSLLHSSTVIEPNHSAFPVSLASTQGYFSFQLLLHY